MIILGIDFGDVRMGFSSCDPSGTLASSVGTVTVSGVRDAAAKAAKKAEEIGAVKIVVGLPVRTDGSAGNRVERTLAFIEILSSLTGLPVETFDERFTSVVAHRFLSDSGLKTKKHKGLVDSVSAALILQDYLDRNRNE